MALGDYRGPDSARAFMRYAMARFAAADRTEIYRAYIAKHLQLLAGTNVSYIEFANGTFATDFDADEVVDDVLARMGLEEE
jgi:hypothetical protein